MDIFIDAHQYGRIAQAQSEAMTAKQKTETFDQRIAAVERRIDRLSLACQALWELLQDKTGLTQQDVYARMEEIDRRDGRHDGRIGGQPVACESCHRTINTLNRMCVYCGAAVHSRNIV